PTVSATAPRIQLDEINPLEKMSFGLVRPGRPYELHILVQPGKFRPGISPELEIDSVEGGAIGATYHSGRLLFQDDRWELGGRVLVDVLLLLRLRSHAAVRGDGAGADVRSGFHPARPASSARARCPRIRAAARGTRERAAPGGLVPEDVFLRMERALGRGPG